MMNQKLLWGAAMAAAAALAGPLSAVEPAAGPATSGVTFELFTASEAMTWNSTQPRELPDFSTRDLREDNSAPTCRSTPNNDADNPQIRILAPALGKTLTPPLDIDLLF